MNTSQSSPAPAVQAQAVKALLPLIAAEAGPYSAIIGVCRETLWKRVSARTQVGPGCWNWNGRKNSKGYGRIAVAGVQRGAHRVVYELLVAPIPSGITLDHLCRNRACVNPDHLDPVTNRENVLRGIGPTAINARKTHCPNGHELTAENVFADSRRGRICKRCQDGRRPNRRFVGTFCSKGHVLDEHTIVYRADGGRRCRICQQERDQIRARRRREIVKNG